MFARKLFLKVNTFSGINPEMSLNTADVRETPEKMIEFSKLVYPFFKGGFQTSSAIRAIERHPDIFWGLDSQPTENILNLKVYEREAPIFMARIMTAILDQRAGIKRPRGYYGSLMDNS